MHIIGDWFRRHFSDPQVLLLTILIGIGLLVTLLLGEMLAPVLASVVIAYLLEGLVKSAERLKIPRLLSVLLVFSAFMLFFLFLLFGLMPLLWQQVGDLFQQLPAMIAWTQKQLLRIAQPYSDYISERQVMEVISALRSELTHLGQWILSLSLASVRVIIWIVVYMFLMPLLVFFFLKDKERILGWMSGFLPEDRRLSVEVWHEVDQQIGNYVRGKFLEILIVWSGTYITFRILDLQFAMLLSFFVGLSVLVPYIGATVMAIPVVLVAYFQWGWGSDFAYAVIAYLLIQFLDGNVLVPFLFSEAVNLHPVAIIVAVLVFGGTLGFWGVFFAIPLATLVKAILNAWTRHIKKEKETTDADKAASEAPSAA